MPVKTPVPQLVGDGEPAAGRPVASLAGVDPDFSEGWEEQSRQRVAVGDGGCARCTPQVVDVAHKQAEVGVGDVLDRDRAIASDAVLEPAPLVTPTRSRTVAKLDSIGLVVRKWRQCSAG